MLPIVPRGEEEDCGFGCSGEACEVDEREESEGRASSRIEPGSCNTETRSIANESDAQIAEKQYVTADESYEQHQLEPP